MIKKRIIIVKTNHKWILSQLVIASIAVISNALVQASAITNASGLTLKQPPSDRQPSQLQLETLRRVTLPGAVQVRADTRLEITEQNEGWFPTPYDDAADYCTIAFGHLLHLSPCDGSEPMRDKRGLKKVPDGILLLQSDMLPARVAVATYVRTPLSDDAYAALCDFVFNVGATNFANSTLLKYVNKNDRQAVAAEFDRWTYAGGKYVLGLKNRRDREVALFFSGSPPPQLPGASPLSPLDISSGTSPKI